MRGLSQGCFGRCTVCLLTFLCVVLRCISTETSVDARTPEGPLLSARRAQPQTSSKSSFISRGRVHRNRLRSLLPGSAGALPAGCPYFEWQKSSYFYELDRQPGFEALENRVVIEWGRAALAWHQHTINKTVTQLLPKGHLLRLFTDYLDFTLTHRELRYLFDHQGANSEWRARLSAVAGVYLILAATTGRQYVGSAYGTDGVWGRWSAYAADGHGGNLLLRQLVETDAAYPAAFTYSILQILPKTAALAETLEWERLYKQKLGSMATGLNAN